MILVELHWCDDCTYQHILLQQATWNPGSDPASRVLRPLGNQSVNDEQAVLLAWCK